MKNWMIWLLAVSISTLLTIGAARHALAETQVEVKTRVPLPFLFPDPPQVVVIPGTYVYVVPDFDMSVLFYHGHWYCPQGRTWYRASHYDGPWKRIPLGHVPRALVTLPPHFRRVPPGISKISHRELQANWREWERRKHWDEDEGWQAGVAKKRKDRVDSK
ncbi:MAG: hypothetical protein C4576_19585 [Desulfobacteraceae bacterium]|nr:MAG: hypothetical protein C4576_19585 [Desulfobacteraceae bacterium]